MIEHFDQEVFLKIYEVPTANITYQKKKNVVYGLFVICQTGI